MRDKMESVVIWRNLPKSISALIWRRNQAKLSERNWGKNEILGNLLIDGTKMKHKPEDGIVGVEVESHLQH